MLEWHFVIKGPQGTPYSGGCYHGKLIFPSDYPYKPPAIMMLTPRYSSRGAPPYTYTTQLSCAQPSNIHDLVPEPQCVRYPHSGRFATNTRLCLSMSDFHPETWVPAWSVASILNGVLSFMLESTPTVSAPRHTHAV